MKTYLTFCVLIGASFLAKAQTNTFPANGNVGIGLTNPSSPLSIQNTSNGWMITSQAQAVQPGHINGLKLMSGYIGESGKWAGIAATAEDIHSNRTGLSFYAGATEKVRLTFAGNLGIGTSSPLSKLQVNVSGANINGGNALTANPNGISIWASTGGRLETSGAQLEFVIPANADGTDFWGQGRIITVAGNQSSSNATGKMILGTRRMMNKLGVGSEWYYGDDIVIDGAGNVGISTTTPKEKLSVNGNIVAKEIKVKTDISVPDYVFEPDYNMLSLAEIENYIREHKHLPEIPSAEEIGKVGLELAKMNLLLLKKVEEQTLYLIEQQKKIDVLLSRQGALQEEVATLKSNLIK